MAPERDPRSDPIDRIFLSRSPFSRRAFLGIAGTTALGAALAACTSKTSTGSSGSAAPSGGGATIAGEVPGPQPVSGGTYGGRVVVGWDTEPYAFGDPARAYNLLDYDVATELVFFGSLLAYGGQTGGPVPNIAAAMPQISSDGTTLTFTLKPGVKFHNGREIEAADFKYSWERAIKPGLKGSWAKSYFSSISGYADLRAGKANELAGVEVVDAKTLKVTLDQPDFMILNVFAQPFAAPLPKEEVERLGDEGFANAPVGFGPFKLESHDSGGQAARFTRFDDYFWEGLPYVDEVEFRWNIDPGLIVPQLQSGDIDIAGNGIPTNQVTRVLADPTTKVLTKDIPVLLPLWIDINRSIEPLGDVRVRQALNWAIDRDAIAKITGNEAYGAPYPANLADFQSTFTPYTYDPEKARSLLNEAGVGSGFTVSLSHTADAASTVQVVQQQLGQVGVTVNLDQVDSSAIYDLQANEDFELMYTGLFMLQPTAGDLVESVYVPSGYANFTKYDNPQVTTLTEEARRDYDVAKQNENYAEIEQLIGEDAPAIFVMTGRFYAGRGAKVQNYQYRGEYGTQYDRLWVSG